MSTTNDTAGAVDPEQAKTLSSTKPLRVLACVLCQQRKIKCDRKFPCTSCLKTRSRCVPATLAPRQRRRGVLERELSDRLRYYETLLLQNNIPFDPPPTATKSKASPSDEDNASRSQGDEPVRSTDEGPSGSSSKSTFGPFNTFNLWRALLDQKGSDDDQDNGDSDYEADDDHNDFFNGDMHETALKKAWNFFKGNSDAMVFGSRKTSVDLSLLHPGHVQIFKLWQVYLDNVDPIFKITHTPTLQASIIDAAGNIAGIDHPMEALLFSIYCVAILSLSDDQCQAMFQSPKQELLAIYQFGCQQALLDCEIFKTEELNCVTAMLLYLTSIKPDTDPRAISTILGAAIRIAQRMGIHRESMNAKCTVFEAEMRRRLWWSLVMFDNRISETSNALEVTILNPTWDCRVVNNFSDLDLRPALKSLPAIHDQATEALFAVVRSELADFLRYSDYHLDWTNASLKAIARETQRTPGLDDRKLAALEQKMESQYFSACSEENPLHFMTIWSTRYQFAKIRLLAHYSKQVWPSVQQTEAQRDAALSHALRIIECNSKLITSPLTKGFIWYIKSDFFFPVFIYVTQDLKKRPLHPHTQKAWKIVSDDLEVRIADEPFRDNPFVKLFSRAILQAWEARETALKESNRPLEPAPWIVTFSRQRMDFMMSSSTTDANMIYSNAGMAADMDMDQFLPSLPAPLASHVPPENASHHNTAAPWDFSDPGNLSQLGFATNQSDWGPAV